MIKSSSIFIILLLAVFLRLILLLIFWNQPATILDEKHYLQLAENLANHQTFSLILGQPTAFRPPLYPLFLSFIHNSLNEINLNTVRIIQILINTINIYFIFLIGKRLFNKNTGLMAALLFSIYPSYIFFTHFLLSEILFTFLLTLLAYSFLLFIDSKKPLYIFLVGLFLGLSALTRSIVYPFIIILFLSLLIYYRKEWKKALIWGLLLISGYLIVIAPWSIRNTQLFNQFVVVETFSGTNVYLGNYKNTPPNHPWKAIEITGEKAYYYGHDKELKGKNEAEKMVWGIAKAKEYMLSHKLQTIKRTFFKAFHFWGLERSVLGFFKNKHIEHLNNNLFLIVFAPIIFSVYILIMISALFGIFFNLTKRNLFLFFIILLVLYSTGLHALTFGHSRYHLPLIPFLLLFSSWTIINIKTILKSNKTWKFRIASTTSLIFCLFWLREIIFVDGADFITIFLPIKN